MRVWCVMMWIQCEVMTVHFVVVKSSVCGYGVHCMIIMIQCDDYG